MDRTMILLEFYQKFFRDKGIVPKRGGVATQHTAWMVDECVAMLSNTGESEYMELYTKVNRWIGFVQGVMWKEGLFSIDELRQHVRDANSPFIWNNLRTAGPRLES